MIFDKKTEKKSIALINKFAGVRKMRDKIVHLNKINRKSRTSKKTNLMGQDRALMLSAWCDEENTEVYDGEGKRIEGQEKKELFKSMRALIMASPYVKARIINMKKRKKTG